MLGEGQEFKEIKDSYVIFMITISSEKDCHFITFKDVLMKQAKFLEMVHISSM